ncbi:RNA polymerase sigma factor [Variovorax boronicumulans]
MALSSLCELEATAGDQAVNEQRNEMQRGLVLQGFLAANYDHLQRRLVRHLGCPEMASECLHDAWLRLGDMEARAAVQNTEAYVYRVACNLAMDRLRTSRPWQYTSGTAADLEQLADHAPGPDRVAAARSDLAAVERAMNRLPRRHRAVLVALRIDELTRHEVAARYDLSLRSVDTALRQALDYCAEHTDQQVLAGVSSSRRALGALRPQTTQT